MMSKKKMIAELRRKVWEKDCAISEILNRYNGAAERAEHWERLYCALENRLMDLKEENAELQILLKEKQDV